MNSPRPSKAEETRARILDAALRLFRERGFERTTMRDVAGEAEVATGAAYYYFRSKEELVMAFYLRTSEEAREDLHEAIRSTRSLQKRMQRIIELKLAQFAEHRELMRALLTVGVDPRHPLSPFGDETKEVRDETIAWYARALEGSDVKVPQDIAPHLPRLLWMYHMGLIYFWLIDDSPGQRRAARLNETTLDLVVQLLKVASLPFMGPLRKRALKVLSAIEE